MGGANAYGVVKIKIGACDIPAIPLLLSAVEFGDALDIRRLLPDPKGRMESWSRFLGP